MVSSPVRIAKCRNLSKEVGTCRTVSPVFAFSIFSFSFSLHASESLHVKSHPFQAHSYCFLGFKDSPLRPSPKGPVNKFLHGEQQVARAKRTKTQHSSLKLHFDLSQHAPFFIFVSANSKKDSHYKPIRVYTRDLRCKQTTPRQDLDMTTLTVYPDSSAPVCWIHPDNRKPE